MKIYEFTLKPQSGFGTPLKGDTIFGQFCWHLIEMQNENIKAIEFYLNKNEEEPFFIFSTAIPKEKVNGYYHYAFKIPTVPDYFLLTEHKKQKELINKFMILKEGDKLSALKNIKIDTIDLKECDLSYSFEKGRRKGNIIDHFIQPHNTINRLIGKTTTERFAPYSVDQIIYHLELALFVGINEKLINQQIIENTLVKLGEYGFGKDASIGLGRFKVTNCKETDLSNIGSQTPNACYTLSPCVPEKNCYQIKYFTPFIRFGRHGNILAKSSNPFKTPVVMMDDGAILKPINDNVFKKPYIGQAIKNVSKAKPETVVQAYSLYIPIYMEENNKNEN